MSDRGWPLLFSEGIRAAAGRLPDKTALRILDGTRTESEISYRDLVREMNAAAHAGLEGLGLRRGDRVALVASNSRHYIPLTCGLGSVGIIVATPNPRLAPAEIAAICRDAGARAVFCEPALYEALQAEDLPDADVIMPLDATFRAWLEKGRDIRPDNALLAAHDDDFVLPYTSGTTGEPKGVRISHISRVLTLYGMGVEYGCFGPDDSFLALAPLCHGAGFAFNLAPLYFGGTCDLMRGFDPEAVAELLAQARHSGVFMVPTHFMGLFGLPSHRIEGLAKNTLKAVISNAAALEQPLKEQIVQHFGEGRLHECYGSTEGGIVTSQRPADQLRKQRCVGLPFVNTEIRLLDDGGDPVADGEPGELFSRSPYLFSGYWNKPDKTRECMRDGWVSAGDVARRDEGGYYYIVDRKKDMVVSGGINIYPREVENVINRHPDVLESAAFGVADPTWGERLEIALVLREREGELAPAELEAFCARHLGRQKIPKHFHRVDALPRNAMGKITKADLVARFGAASENGRPPGRQ